MGNDKRIIYAEDDTVSRTLVEHFLKKKFSSVYSAENGKEALDFITAHGADLLITDLEMPVMNGFELIKQIDLLGKTIPVIVTTAYREEAEKINRSVIILHKPVKLKELEQTIEQLLS